MDHKHVGRQRRWAVFAAGAVLLALRAAVGPAQAPAQAQEARPRPTHADVAYGAHPRQVLDFYRAPGDRPAPVIVFIHGGGFVAGDKAGFPLPLLRGAHEHGIHFASINYRFVDGEKVLFPMPQHDGARAVQFIRSRAAEWGVDPVKTACVGGSAGAGISMWVGFHDDLKKPESADPVERQSTRIQAVATMGGQGTYDPIRIKELVGGRAWEHPSLLKVYGLKSTQEALNPTPAQKRLYDEASADTHLTRDDPPLFMIYSEPDIVPPPDSRPGQFIHHPNFGKDLKKRMDRLGIENHYVHTSEGGNPQRRMVEFLVKHLKPAR
jgi:acetyl esterase